MLRNSKPNISSKRTRPKCGVIKRMAKSTSKKSKPKKEAPARPKGRKSPRK